MVTDEPISFIEKRKQLLEQRARERGETLPIDQPPPAATPPPQFHPDVQLPDLYDGKRTEDEKQLDSIINGIDFPTAYNKWINKSHAVETKSEGNMISCPNPDHPDKTPSAWFDNKGLWNCARCNDGGDIYDLAAIRFGYPRPGYKEGADFHKLREDMAESFGWHIKRVPGGQILYQDAPSSSAPPPPVSQPAQQDLDPGLAPPVAPADAPTEGSVSDLGSADPDASPEVAHMWADDEEPELVVYPTIDWKNLIPEDTFLYEYMKACSQDDSPEEYHFWHGLMGLGLVCGRNVTLDDTRPVYGNLLLCILGATGTGKSRSLGWLNTVLRDTAPYHEDGTRTTGVKQVPVPGSGEYLVSEFSYEGKDPSGGKSSLGYQSVAGIVDFDEMAALLSRANRMGSTLKSTIMGFADARNEVKIGSLSGGVYIAADPFCSITASTQPRAVRAMLNRTDSSSGFLNRWVFAGGKEKQAEAIGGSHSDTSINLDDAIQQLKYVRGWGAVERSIRLEPDAYDLYVKYFREVLSPTKTKDETDLLKRIDLISKKLMLLLTINLRRLTVPKSVVEAVIEIMEYVVECFGILNENIGVTVMQDVMNEIQRHILRHKQKTGRGASARDISRYTARKNYSLEQIKKALEVMTALDLIELEPKATGSNMGRPTVRYQPAGEA